MEQSLEKERGFCLCSDKSGKLSKGEERVGTQNKVSFPVDCPSGSKLHSTYHTHPSNDLRPSQADINVMERFNIPICISTPSGGKIRCYRPRSGKSQKK